MCICTLLVKVHNSPRQMVNEFWKRLFNAIAYTEFRVCFTLVKCENDMLSLCETTNVFIDAFCDSQTNFYQFNLIQTIVKSLHVLLGLSLVWNRYLKGSH